MSTDFFIAVFTAIGLVLVIEGLVLALAPDAIRRMWETLKEQPNESLRRIGLGAVMLGVFIVWLSRG